MYLIFWKDVYLLICFKRSRFLSFIQRHLYLLARAAVSECQMRVMEQQKRVAWQFWGPQVWGQDTGRLGSPWRLRLRLVDGCPIWFSLYVLQLMRSVCPNLLLSDWIRAHPKGLMWTSSPRKSPVFQYNQFWCTQNRVGWAWRIEFTPQWEPASFGEHIQVYCCKIHSLRQVALPILPSAC